jgi:hypothetical protein
MAALVRADERLKKEFPLITLPVLILHGTVDKNTNPSGSQHFLDNVGSVDKTLKPYKECSTIFSTTSTGAWLCRTSKTGSVARLPATLKTSAQARAESLQETLRA